MPKVPKVPCICLQYLQRSLGDEVNFLPADKHGSFLQVDSIHLDVCSQACPKYPKQQIYNIFVKYQGKLEGWNWTFAYR